MSNDSSCTLPALYPVTEGAVPPPPSAPSPVAAGRSHVNTLPSVPKPPLSYRNAHMDMSEQCKSITRLLQHSILQLCNEHIGYSHKLQILGVLCMTVDDEQQELVVKVNNTLKRVNPPPIPSKDMCSAPQLSHSAITPVASTFCGYSSSMDHHLYNGRATSEELGTTSPNQPLSLQAHTNDTGRDGVGSNVAPKTGRRSHGRKGARPVKVQHVFDEGDICSEDDYQDVFTVIPTDPESSYDLPSPQPNRSERNTPETSPPKVKIHGSAKRKAGSQFHNGLSYSLANNESNPGATGRSISAVRALLLGRASHMTCSPQDLSTGNSNQLSENGGNSPPRGLTLPVFVAQEKDPEQCQSMENGIQDATSPADLNVNGTSTDTSRKHTGNASPSAFDRKLQIKEEPEDFTFTGYNNNNNNSSGSMDTGVMDSTPEDLSQHLASIQNYAQINGSLIAPNPVLARTLDGLPTQVPYTIAFSTSTPNKHMDGLSIQYTSNGPITVGTNGKNVSLPTKSTKVKDIILYDDSSPLHEQRGNRIETDYMLDSFGLEGRKRRRRNADETLTAEEVAEYLGSLDVMPQMFKCKYCTEELCDLTGYLQHTLAMHHCYICHQCGKSFTTKSSLLRHRPIHTGMRRFACSICKKTFYRKDKCKAHIKRHLGEAGEKAEVQPCDQVESFE